MSGIITTTQSWIKDFIIKESICPFASRPFIQDQIHYVVSHDQSFPEQVQICLSICMQMQSTLSINTAFLIIDDVDLDFEELLDLIETCTSNLPEYSLELEFQLVPFHPQFLFEEADPNDPIHYTNRSPFPMIHILREKEVTEAVNGYRDIALILEKNKKTTNRLFGN